MIETAVHLESFSYAYPPDSGWASRAWALKDLSFDIPPGQRVAILGLSGAGKTTLCLALKGIVPQFTGGRVWGIVQVGESDPLREPVARLAGQIGMVFQEPETQFFNLTVEDEIAFGLENLALPHEEIGDRIEQALDMVGLAWARYRHPRELSGGEKQLVAIASVLAMRPSVMVLDEPISNLDPGGRRAVRTALEQLESYGRMTTLISGSDFGWQASLCDRVLVLDQGVLAFDGSAEQFVQQETGGGAQYSALHGELMQLSACLSERTGGRCAFSTLDEAMQVFHARLRSAENSDD